jgi:predicted permease
MSNTDPTKKLGVNSDILDVNIIEEYSCQIMVPCSIFSLFKFLDNQKFLDFPSWFSISLVICCFFSVCMPVSFCAKNIWTNSCQIMVPCSIFSLFKFLDNQKFYSDISHWKIFKHLIIKMIKQRDNTAVCTKNH